MSDKSNGEVDECVNDTERVNATELGALIYENFDVSTLEAKTIAERGVESNWQIHTDTDRSGVGYE